MEVRNRYCDKCKNPIVREPCWKLRLRKAPDKPMKMDLCEVCIQDFLNYFLDEAQADDKFVQIPDAKELSASEVIEVKKVTPNGQPRKKRNSEQVMALRRFGLSNAQIADEIDATANIVAMNVYHFKKNLKDSEVEKYENIDVAKVLALHKAGWADSDIADEMYVSEKYITELLFVDKKYSFEK